MTLYGFGFVHTLRKPNLTPNGVLAVYWLPDKNNKNSNQGKMYGTL
jgi:hypothetical protein